MTTPKLAAARLREVLTYDPETGGFVWRVQMGRLGPVGSVAGSISPTGYLNIGIDGSLYRAHRLAFLYMEGAFPPALVDHINGDGLDNRWCNLRHATNVTNLQNLRQARSDSRTGLMGVHRLPSGRWQARITIHGERRSLGAYTTPEQAAVAYLAAKRELHEGNTL